MEQTQDSRHDSQGVLYAQNINEYILKRQILEEFDVPGDGRLCFKAKDDLNNEFNIVGSESLTLEDKGAIRIENFYINVPFLLKFSSKAFNLSIISTK